MTNLHGLKMQAKDDKMRLTDVADTEQVFRLIQSSSTIGIRSKTYKIVH